MTEDKTIKVILIGGCEIGRTQALEFFTDKKNQQIGIMGVHLVDFNKESMEEMLAYELEKSLREIRRMQKLPIIAIALLEETPKPIPLPFPQKRLHIIHPSKVVFLNRRTRRSRDKLKNKKFHKFTNRHKK